MHSGIAVNETKIEFLVRGDSIVLKTVIRQGRGTTMKPAIALLIALVLTPTAALYAADLELNETLQLPECHSLGWARINSQPAAQQKGAWAVDQVLWLQRDGEVGK